MRLKPAILTAATLVMVACGTKENDMNGNTRFITLNPGHFHAALVQKSSYENVSDTVYVYAPAGEDLDQHLARISGFNSRELNPTSWKEIIYTGEDYLQKMVEEKQGNVVVLAGDNKKKIQYVKSVLDAGMNVLADKPVIISPDDFPLLEQCFKEAEDKGLLFYDIMTERNEITTILQRELTMIPEIYGRQTEGTPENPAVTKESVHHFYKNVSGNALVRPAWFYDTDIQGEGIVDVTTHLVDLVQWECFPETILDYKTDIKLTGARHWATPISLEQFSLSTGYESFPEFLQKDIIGDTLHVYSNGEINYALKGVNVKISVIWNFQPPQGGGDTHYSVMKGEKANIVIRQGEEQNFIPELYIEAVSNDQDYKNEVEKQFAKLGEKYPGVELEETENGWHVVIADSYRNGHEAHFGQVTENFLQYLQDGKLPKWEVPNMIAKYYTTTSALEMARKK